MSHLLSASASIRFQPPSLGFAGTLCFVKKHHCCSSVKRFCLSQKTGTKTSCSMNMSAQQSDDHGRMKLEQLIDKARKLWDSSPELVKKFPWSKALDNFIQLILDLILVVVKYLSVPVFAVTSLSELSYCAHEKKLAIVPLPVLFGITVAGILKETALEISPRLRVGIHIRMTSPGPSSRIQSGAVTNSMPFFHSNSAATSTSMPRSSGRADNPINPGSH